MWHRAFGDFENRSGSANLSFGGFLGGADGVIAGLASANDALIIGAMGGFEASRVDLRNS